MKLKKKNKLLFGAVSTAAVIAAPAIMVSCGSTESDKAVDQEIKDALKKLTKDSVKGLHKDKLTTDPSQAPTVKAIGKVQFIASIITRDAGKGTLTVSIMGQVGTSFGKEPREFNFSGFKTN